MDILRDQVGDGRQIYDGGQISPFELEQSNRRMRVTEALRNEHME
jgi:hypothetical protein